MTLGPLSTTTRPDRQLALHLAELSRRIDANSRAATSEAAVTARDLDPIIARLEALEARLDAWEAQS